MDITSAEVDISSAEVDISSAEVDISSAEVDSCVVIENNAYSSSNLVPLIGQNGNTFPNTIPESFPEDDNELIPKCYNEALSEQTIEAHLPEIDIMEPILEQDIIESLSKFVIPEPVPECKPTSEDCLESIPGHGTGSSCQTSYIIRCNHMTSSWIDDGESTALVDVSFQINTDVRLFGVVGPVGAGKVGVAWI